MIDAELLAAMTEELRTREAPIEMVLRP